MYFSCTCTFVDRVIWQFVINEQLVPDTIYRQKIVNIFSSSSDVCVMLSGETQLTSFFSRCSSSQKWRRSTCWQQTNIVYRCFSQNAGANKHGIGGKSDQQKSKQGE
jgi:hypothetical protein